MAATCTPEDETGTVNGRHEAGRHVSKGCQSPPSDIQLEEASKISFLPVPGGDVKISGGHFDAVAGNQIRFEVNMNGCKPGSTRSCSTNEEICLHDLQPDRVDDFSPPLDDSEIITSLVGKTNDAAYTTYFRCLATRERGSPLWIPEPNKQLPVLYQRNGFVMGDVGIITDEGFFDTLFNIALPPDHPLAINSDDLPRNFAPLEIKPGHVFKSSKFKKGASLSSGSISVKTDDSSGSTFDSYASQGAILTLPDGSSSEDLRNKKKLCDYLAVNLEEIYRCAMNEHGRIINNGDIRVITGFDKTTSWGMAAFRNATSQTKPSFHLKIRPRDRGCSEHIQSWKSTGTAEVKTGPDMREVVALRMDDPSQQNVEYENQAVFVRTENATLNPRVWKKLLDEAGIGGDLELDDDSEATSDSTSSAGSQRNGQAPNRYTVSYSNNPITTSLTAHPADGINNMLLKLNPDAWMAVTGDDIWISFLKEDDRILPTTDSLWTRIKEEYVVRLENGIVFLDKRNTVGQFIPENKLLMLRRHSSPPSPMQRATITGICIRSAADACVIFHSVFLKIFPMVSTRLNNEERHLISSGSVYIWEERDPNSELTRAGIERWTDGIAWGPSRFREGFRLYHERTAPQQHISNTICDPPLIKQTYSVYVDAADSRRKWHLIAYFTQDTIARLRTIDEIPQLATLVVPDGQYQSAQSTKGRIDYTPPARNRPRRHVPPRITHPRTTPSSPSRLASTTFDSAVELGGDL